MKDEIHPSAFRLHRFAGHLFPLHPSAAVNCSRYTSIRLKLISYVGQPKIYGDAYPALHRPVAETGGRKTPTFDRFQRSLIQRFDAGAAIHFDGSGAPFLVHQDPQQDTPFLAVAAGAFRISWLWGVAGACLPVLAFAIICTSSGSGAGSRFGITCPGACASESP